MNAAAARHSIEPVPAVVPRPARLLRSCRSRAAQFISASVLGGATLAMDFPVSPAHAAITDLTLSTTDQGMWAPDKLQGSGGTNTHTAFYQNFPNATFGDIVETRVPGTGGTVPNPLWAAWFACTQVSPICPDEPPTTIPNPVPAQFVKNGAELKLSNMHLDFGVKTTLQFAPGKVASDVHATAELTVPESPVAPGQVFTLGSAGAVNDATLATDFDLFNFGLTPFVNLTAKATLEAWAVGANVIPLQTILNLPIHAEEEFIGARIGDGGLELRAFGEATFIDVPSGIGLNIPVPGVVPPPLNHFVGFPMGDVQLFIPSLDTPPLSSFDATAKTVTNKQDTDTRLGATPLITFGDLGIGANGPTAIDFGMVNIDLDVFSLLDGFALGISGGIPLTATVEINALDLDFGTLLGVGQTLTMTPYDILVDLTFSTPVQVETSPGVFEYMSARTIRLGDPLNIVQPDGDLEITPRYRLDDNLFTNLTQLFLTPGFTLDFMQLKFGGVLFSALGLGDYKIFSQFIPVTGDPVPVHTFADKEFALADWTIAEGTPLHIAAAANGATVPEPTTLLLIGIGLAGLGFTRRSVARS
jgi:PEP-CTERM motif